MGRQQAKGLDPAWNSWLAALLAASILSSCFLLTEGQGIQIQVQPERPIEGQNVTLIPKGLLYGARTCVWYRGLTTDSESLILIYFPSTARTGNGPVFTNRETVGSDCSLHIRNLISGDTRNYTVNVMGPGLNALGTASLVVSDVQGPYVKLNPRGTVELKMGSYLKLECLVNSVPAVHLQWFFNDVELNVTGNIFSTQVKDQGAYTCQAINPLTKHRASDSAYVKLEKVSGSSVSSSLSAGSLAGIILGSLTILALNGTLLYFIFRARGQDDKTSGQIEGAPSSSDNFGPSRQQVKPESSAENPVYQTLQHGDQATYEQLNIAADKSTNIYTIAE